MEHAFDLIADPAVINKVIELAKAKGLDVSKPMPTDSVSEALDAPFGVTGAREILEIITVMTTAIVPIAAFLVDIKSLLGRSETSAGGEATVEVRRTKNQKKIGKIDKTTNLSELEV